MGRCSACACGFRSIGWNPAVNGNRAPVWDILDLSMKAAEAAEAVHCFPQFDRHKIRGSVFSSQHKRSFPKKSAPGRQPAMLFLPIMSGRPPGFRIIVLQNLPGPIFQALAVTLDSPAHRIKSNHARPDKAKLIREEILSEKHAVLRKVGIVSPRFLLAVPRGYRRKCTNTSDRKNKESALKCEESVLCEKQLRQLLALPEESQSGSTADPLLAWSLS